MNIESHENEANAEHASVGRYVFECGRNLVAGLVALVAVDVCHVELKGHTLLLEGCVPER